MGVEGPMLCYTSPEGGAGQRYFFLENLADNTVVYKREANLLSILVICNALRTMGRQDQERFKFQMTRVLPIGRMLELRCQDLFMGLIDAQARVREEVARRRKRDRR